MVALLDVLYAIAQASVATVLALYFVLLAAALHFAWCELRKRIRG
jgi:RsiW-degrading membrane proteinase PrsW (M82 family)